MAYSSQKTVPSAVSACSKEVRDAQAKIREVLRTSDAIPDAEKALISNLLDGLTEAIDDQMVLSVENMNRIRKTEAAAVKQAKDIGVKMQKIVAYCEQQTGAKVDHSLYVPEELSKLPPARRRKQVTVFGLDLDRIDVDEETAQPVRAHYTSHGKYSSSEDEAAGDDDNDGAHYSNDFSDTSPNGSVRRTFSTDSRDSKRSGALPRKRVVSIARSSARSGANSRKFTMDSTQPLNALDEKLFSISKGNTEGSSNNLNSTQKIGNGRDKYDADGKRTGRKNAGDYILDQVAAKGVVSSSPPRSQYTSKVAAGPDRLTLEGLSCFLYSLLQSTSHFLQAERARLYIPHQENKIMKVVCAVPDASIVCYRGGQYVAAHQGLPGAAMATGVAITVDKVNDDIRRNYLSTTLHGGGSLAAEEQQRGDADESTQQNATRNKRSGTVESIMVFPIRHATDSSKVVGVFEFINKIHLQPWTEHDEQLCFTASRLASYWLSTYETLLDLHQLPAFQPQESYFLAAPYRPAGFTTALAKNNLSHIGKHVLPLFVARVTELDDIPSKKEGTVTAPGITANSPIAAGSNPAEGAGATSPTHSDRIKEVGAIRYVRELTAYLRELERSSRTNVAEIVQTRDSQARQVDEIIKQKSKVKALEDNNSYLRDKLLETQKKLSVYMNQLHGNSQASPLLEKTSKKIANNGNATTNSAPAGGKGALVTTGGDRGESLGGHLPPLTAGATPTGSKQSRRELSTGEGFRNTTSRSENFSALRNSPNLSASLQSTFHTQGGPDDLFTRAPPSLATLKDFLFEAQQSVKALKTQALMTAPPNTSASLYSALANTTTKVQKQFGSRAQHGVGRSHSSLK